MKVVVDMQKLSNLYSGLGQFCFHLGKELLNESKDENIIFYGKKKVGFTNAEFYEPSLLARITGKNTNDINVWHCTHQEPKYIPDNIPYVLTIHDLNFLYKYKSEWRINIKIRKLQKLINNSSAIVAVSQFTLNEINNNFLIPDVQQKVIYNGLTLDENIKENKPDFVSNVPFLFSIGIISAKKNFHVLIPFIKQLDYKLIIAGDNTSDYAKKLIKEAEASDISHKIILPGKISEEEKIWLYKHCDAFVFPSLSEGFGLPVIEAMSFGKPVFLSKKTSLPEIGAELAFYWENFNTDHMLDVFNKGMTVYSDDLNYTNKLKLHSKKFSWAMAARQYLDLYSSLADKTNKTH